MSAERFKAERAYSIGLVHQVVPTPDDLDAAVEAVLANVLQCGPNAMAVAKRLVLDLSWPERRAQFPDYLEYVAKTLSGSSYLTRRSRGGGAFLKNVNRHGWSKISEARISYSTCCKPFRNRMPNFSDGSRARDQDRCHFCSGRRRSPSSHLRRSDRTCDGISSCRLCVGSLPSVGGNFSSPRIWVFI